MLCLTPRHSVTFPHFFPGIIKYVYITFPLCQCGSNKPAEAAFQHLETWCFETYHNLKK